MFQVEWRKALGLLKGGESDADRNGWILVVYQQDEETITALKAMVPKWFSPLRARWHYYLMARKNFRGYLQGDEVRLKKYFYVLRPLLAVRWVEAEKAYRQCALLSYWREANLMRRYVQK